MLKFLWKLSKIQIYGLFRIFSFETGSVCSVMKYFANFSRFDFHCGVSWGKQQQGTMQVEQKSTVLLNKSKTTYAHYFLWVLLWKIDLLAIGFSRLHSYCLLLWVLFYLRKLHIVKYKEILYKATEQWCC